MIVERGDVAIMWFIIGYYFGYFVTQDFYISLITGVVVECWALYHWLKLHGKEKQM